MLRLELKKMSLTSDTMSRRLLLQPSKRDFHDWHSFSSFLIFLAIYTTTTRSTLHATRSKPLLKIGLYSLSVSVNLMGSFCSHPSFYRIICSNNITDMMKRSHFVHVLFEAAVDAVTLWYRALEFIKLLGVHIELRGSGEKNIIPASRERGTTSQYFPWCRVTLPGSSYRFPAPSWPSLSVYTPSPVLASAEY